MIKYGNKMISDPGKYLKCSNGRVGYKLDYEESLSYEEIELTDAVIKRPDGSVSYGGVFNFKIADFSKKWLKSYFVKRAFDIDDQMAIMLNKDDSEKDAEVYDFMQSWREWSSRISDLIMEQLRD